MNNSGRNFTDAMKSLNDFIDSDLDYRTMPIEEIKKELKSHGIDLNRAVRDVRLTINKKISAESLQKARKIRERFLALIDSIESKQQSVIESFAQSRQEIMDEIISFSQKSLGGLPAAYFRNLDQRSDKDLISLLDDLKKLDQLEQGDLNG